MFVRICPYLPFSARVCLNQHHWLANRMREEDIDFKQCGNAFPRCSAPERLRQLADSLEPRELLTPFFTAREREEAGCQHRLFFSQVEFCDNLISIAARRWTSLGSGCSMPIERSASPTRSP